MLIRSFTLSDYESILDFAKKSLTSACYTTTFQVLIRQLTLDSSLILLCIESDQVKGVAIGTIDHNIGYVYRLITEDVCIRKNLAVGLQQLFAQRKVSRISIVADEFNQKLAQELPQWIKCSYKKTVSNKMLKQLKNKMEC